LINQVILFYYIMGVFTFNVKDTDKHTIKFQKYEKRKLLKKKTITIVKA